MKQLPYILFFLLISLMAMTCLADDEFPNRMLYPETTPISLEKLKATKNDVTIVDVRSFYEYNTLHIKDAINIPLNANNFMEEIQAIKPSADKPVVFYCNGKTCKKSYKAALRVIKGKIPAVLVYDAGIFDWARAYPEESVLLEKPLNNAGKLISSDYLKAHMLEHNDFIKKARTDKSIILDIRDPVQREGMMIFSHRENVVPLDNNKLQRYVDQAKNEGKSLMIYDAVGKQVRWLQYYLEEQGVKDYYFMKGGADAYFENYIAKYRQKL